ncbi:MAG: hypothetical protein HKN39_05895 [Flavobacteriales bacterium]|nr:hypothetical protein [Flavobacteriales bacterium]
MIDPDLTFKNLVHIVQKRWRAFVFIAIIAAIAGVVFTSSLFMKPRFTSTAVAYPKNLEPFSDESETEQMLQLMEFSEIKDTLVDKYELYNRWGLTPGQNEYYYWLDYLYAERVSISANKYEAVVIECQDESADTAKLMVDEILNQYNRLTRAMEQGSNLEYLQQKEDEVAFLKHIIDESNKSLSEIREEAGIINLSGQLERLMEGYMRMHERGDSGKRYQDVVERLKSLNKNGGELMYGSVMMENLGLVYAEVLEDMNEAKAYSSRNVTYANVIKKPRVADKKSWPIRWIIWLGIFGGSLLLALILFAIFDRKEA